MNVTTEYVQPMEPKFGSHGITTIDNLDGNSGIWIPNTRIRRTRSASGNSIGKGIEVGDAVGDYREEDHKNDFKVWNKDSKLQSEQENIKMI